MWQDGLEVVGEAADGVEAIAQFRKHQPDITLIDLRMPRMSGVDVIQRIRMETPQARFIVLTTYDGDEDIYRALKAGARVPAEGHDERGTDQHDSSGSCGQVAYTAGDRRAARRAHGRAGSDAARVRCAGADCVWQEQSRRLRPNWRFQRRR
jgi:CheY-like chemotaxis protein